MQASLHQAPMHSNFLNEPIGSPMTARCAQLQRQAKEARAGTNGELVQYTAVQALAANFLVPQITSWADDKANNSPTHTSVSGITAVTLCAAAAGHSAAKDSLLESPLVTSDAGAAEVPGEVAVRNWR